MRRFLCLLSLTVTSLLAAGCQQDFDAQYAETERKVKAAEAKIDAEMENGLLKISLPLTKEAKPKAIKIK